MSINTIRQRGAPILGLIVNGVPIDNPYYYYTTYYYASYYHRTQQPDESLYQDRRDRTGQTLEERPVSASIPDSGRAPEPSSFKPQVTTFGPDTHTPTNGNGSGHHDDADHAKGSSDSGKV